MAKVKSIYIADGITAQQAQVRAQKVKKNKTPNHTGKEEYTLFFLLLFSRQNQLRIKPYNRVVVDLNGLNKDQLIKKISGNFSIQETLFAKSAGEKNLLQCTTIKNVFVKNQTAM
jgi:uncharacterized protein (DUF1015 family)